MSSGEKFGCNRTTRVCHLAVLMLVLAGSCRGLTASRLYTYGDDWADERLPPADEVSSTEIPLQTPFVFYGARYTSLFINMNGFISFLTEIPSYFNIQFPLDYPIISAFYSDVDTTSAGSVWYRETSDPATMSRLKTELGAYFAAAADFTPTGVFIATWDGVGGHKLRPNKVNTYQILLASDGRESYVVFLYADRGLQWLRGNGKNPSLPDALAQAGFISGDGRMKLIRGSGKDQVRNLDKWSNVGEPGVWVFRVGQIGQTSNVAEPDIAPESEDEEGSCSVGGLMCHSTASCVDYSPGFCCKCPDSTFGNGINCVRRDEPLRVTGKVSGNLNGVVLEEADLHSYILTAEGRTYTAVSRVPKNQGYDMQILVPIGTGITWLFANPTEGVPNGFTLTGGQMNRTVTLDFPQTGHSASVQQQFLGLDVFENVEVTTFIAGTLPNIPLGTKIEVEPFVEEYTRVSRGQLRARSNRVFKLKGQEIETPFQVETTIEFDECAWIPPVENSDTLRLRVSENIFIQYDGPEKIVRFALSSSVGPLTEEDPCIRGKAECGDNSQCVVDGAAFRCICNRGYEQVFDPAADAAVCLDKDECSTGRHQCDDNALCTNTQGAYTCACRHGYVGDGYSCQGETSCDTVTCDPHAACRIEEGAPRCFCPPHLTGDGYHCYPAYDASVPDTDVLGTQECGPDVCGVLSDCRFDEDANDMRCYCRQGYAGDGNHCTLMASQVSCDIEENCSPYGTCLQEAEGVYKCSCLPGFAGDGYSCYLDTGFNSVDDNFDSSNIVAVPINKIPDYVLGGDYGHIPVEFDVNPYGDINQLPHDGNIGIIDVQHGGSSNSGQDYTPPEVHRDTYYVPVETHPNPQDPNQGVNYNPQTGVNFDNEALGPAYSVDVPNVPVPYVPPQVDQEPLQPYQPDSDTREGIEPQCSLGTCFCPPGYKFNKFSGKCEMQSMDDYVASPYDPEHPLPYCGAAKCTCPEPFTYNREEETCDPQPSSDNPTPDCEGGRFPCLCPQGYYFQYPQNTCEPRGPEDYDDSHHEGQGGEYHPLLPYPYSPEYGPIPGGDEGGMYPGYPVIGGNVDGVEPPRPVPECVGDALPCICPTGYYFQYPERTCEPRGASNYDYSVKGGGDPRPHPPHLGFGQVPDGGQLPPDFGLPHELSCNVMNVCHEYAACIFKKEIDIYMCECNRGFAGDGFTCIRQDFSCDKVNICHVNAQCVYDDLEMRSVCVCLTGYVGDGTVCTPEDECNSVQDCDVNAQCGFDSVTQRYRCSCNGGYTGDGRTCVPAADSGCNIINKCHHQADCVFDIVALTHRCQCRPGYEGDGTICNEIQLNCDVLRNCGQHAQCTELSYRDYRCVCLQGYTGDGYYCQPTQSCQQSPGMCHQMASCQPDPASNLGYSCQCQRGYIGDGFTCVEAPTFESNILLLNQGLSVLRLPVDAQSRGGGYPITVDAFMSAVGSDIDCFAGRYYWTDVGTRTIRSSNYDGTERKPVVSRASIGSPEDVAVDWISRNIYWTDSVNDEIVASSIEGGLRRTIITGDLVNPRGIAVHPGRGLLFWSDWNRLGPKIESSGLDGSDRRTLVDTNIELPNSLVVDYETSTVCWADAGTHKIECIGVTGKDRRTVIKGPKYPFGLTLHEHHFYYTDWDDERVHVVNKYTGSEEPSRPPPPGGSGRLYGITAVASTCPPVSNVCQGHGGCPPNMLCLPNSYGGRTCACPANPPEEGGDYQGCTDIAN